MAKSPSHELGELIGNFFEDVMKSPMQELCNKYNVYFDTIGLRPARKSKKVTWSDVNGNKHDLDYVIERNGTPNSIGDPIAFIELAWRRYTKHSRNKVQEIAGALLPIAQKYCELAPFLGVVLSGVFTEASINQLETQGFHVLYIPYENVVDSFKRCGVDIFYDESTSEKELSKLVKQLKACNKKHIQTVKKNFIESNREAIDKFMNSLELSLRRRIKNIKILPLHGLEQNFDNLHNAINYIKDYNTIPVEVHLDRILIKIDFNDGSCIKCEFKEKNMAISFLKRNVIEYSM